jgi:hypothetical protein
MKLHTTAEANMRRLPFVFASFVFILSKIERRVPLFEYDTAIRRIDLLIGAASDR